MKVIYLENGTTALPTTALDTSVATTVTLPTFINFPYLVANGAPGVVAAAAPVAVFTAATKTLVITVGAYVHTFVFMNSNMSTMFNMSVSLTCPTIASCSGPAVTGNAANWAGVGLGDGAWATNFQGWAINGAISTLA